MAVEELYLRDDVKTFIGDKDPFACFANLDGEVFRALESRRTYAVTLGDKRFFVKYHRGTPTREVIKNLLQLRLPVTSASNEWQALTRLQQLGIKVPVIAAYGKRGLLPQTTESFIVTEDVGTQMNLEDLTRDWSQNAPTWQDKQALMREVAAISRRMHGNGICHRDFYICHFLVRGDIGKRLTLIDLHRALVKRSLGQRWIIKDVGSLYFSAVNIGLTQRDLLRFVRGYSGESLRSALGNNGEFWRKVKARADRLVAKHG